MNIMFFKNKINKLCYNNVFNVHYCENLIFISLYTIYILLELEIRVHHGVLISVDGQPCKINVVGHRYRLLIIVIYLNDVG